MPEEIDQNIDKNKTKVAVNIDKSERKKEFASVSISPDLLINNEKLSENPVFAKVSINEKLFADKQPNNITVKVALKETSDFMEETINFPSVLKRDPDYSCYIVFIKPDERLYSVSVYMIEKYLGRYAHKSNYYFLKENKSKAISCYNAVLDIVKNLKNDVFEQNLKQSEIPHILKRALRQKDFGGISPKSNSVAVYLNPANTENPKEGGSSNILYIPKQNNVFDSLEIEKK